MFFTSVFPVLLTTLFRRFFQAFPFVFFPASLSGFAFLLLPPKAGPLLYLINIGPFIPVSTGVINVMNSEARQAVPFFLPLYPLVRGVFDGNYTPFSACFSAW